MIYLFCNDGYGAEFRNAAERLSSSQNHDITLVFSMRRSPPPSTTLPRVHAEVQYWAKRALESIHRYRSLALPFIITSDVNGPTFQRRIRRVDHGVIAGFNQIFRATTIERFASLVNFHPSLLPLYRGPVPSHWCLQNAETRTGYSLHRVTARIDEGEILYQDQVPVLAGDTPNSIDLRIAQAALPCFRRYLMHVTEGNTWTPAKIRAEDIYRTHLGYASFPRKT